MNNESELPLIEQLQLIDSLQLENLHNQISLVFEEAIQNQWNLQQFAIKILANCAARKPVYVLITSMLIQKATNLAGTENYALVEHLINVVHQNNSQEIRKGVQIITQGLAINELKTNHN
ncbi:hypothetical protein [Microcoleus sp. B3-D7]|uniref:hypothetical protein n=1 Tax=Microcoleus sp. B3-D7 TaxID=2818659 RepID=UPI002FCF9069